MSLLLANGHPEAHRYSISRVFEEAELIVERENARMAEAASMLDMVLAAQPNEAIKANSTKGARRSLKKALETLLGR